MGNHGISGNTGNVTINTRPRNVVVINRQGVVNSEGGTIRLYHSRSKMQPGDIVGKGSGEKLMFKDSCSIPYMFITVDRYFSFLPPGTRYASILLESSTYSDECEETIAENCEVRPKSGSVLVIGDSYTSGNVVGGNMIINTRSTVVANNRGIVNATGKNIRVYYGDERMQPEDIVMKGSEAGKLAFKEDSSIPYISILAKDSFDFSGEGINYASIYLEGGSNECEKTISENYEVPSDKSFIVTADLSIKFQ